MKSLQLSAHYESYINRGLDFWCTYLNRIKKKCQRLNTKKKMIMLAEKDLFCIPEWHNTVPYGNHWWSGENQSTWVCAIIVCLHAYACWNHHALCMMCFGLHRWDQIWIWKQAVRETNKQFTKSPRSHALRKRYKI